MKTISFIGAGKMAEAILQGLLKNKLFTGKNISLSDVSAKRLEELSNKYSIKTTSNNLQAIQSSKIVLLAIKPQNIPDVLEELSAVGTAEQIVISIVAGITIKKIDPDNKLKVCRVMPNTPAVIGEAASAVAFGQNVTDQEKDQVMNIFRAIGTVIEIDESKINAVTGLSGSGPAFVFNLMKNFIEAGRALGLSEKTAQQLTYQTFLGSAKLAQETETPLDILIDQVTSPNGTTAAGREILENSDVGNVLINTITQAKVRADELNKG